MNRIILGVSTMRLPTTANRTPEVAMDLAKDAGADVCHFESITQLVPTLNHSSAREAGRYARNLALGISCGVVFLAPNHKERSPHVLELGRGNWLKGMQRVLDLAGTAGVQRLVGIVGHAADRLAGEGPWRQQVEDTTGMLLALSPTLRDNGQKLLIKNHPEINSSEACAMIRAVGQDVLGLAFDPVNVITRREDPASTAADFAANIGQVQLDDAVLEHDGPDLVRRLVPFGHGNIDWTSIIRELQPAEHGLPLILDRHRATIRVLGSGWQPGMPTLTQNDDIDPGNDTSNEVEAGLEHTMRRIRMSLAVNSAPAKVPQQHSTQRP